MNRRLRSLWPTSLKARVILVCFVVIFVVLISFWALRAKKPQVPFDAGNIALKLRQDQIEKLNQDSDTDGLKDWEEFLYHTDPQKPDTDGDGTQDGEEIKQNRDPAKPNTTKAPKKPDDYFATAEPLTDKDNKPLGADKNLTADFTRTFLRGPLAKILAGDQADIDTKSVEQYADQLKGRSILADAPRFTAKDIRINPATDDQTIIRYFNAVRDIFRVLNLRGRNEMDIVADALTSQDYGGLVEMASYPDAYQKTIGSMRSFATPKNLTEYHLTLLNYLAQFRRSTELLQQMETDPILGILTINERLKLNEELAASLDRLADKSITISNK